MRGKGRMGTAIHARAMPAKLDGGARTAYLAAGLATAWVLADGLGLLGPLSGSTFMVLTAAAAAATVVGVRRHRPSVRWPWIMIASAFVLFLVGGGVREAFGTLGDLSSRRSIVPDLITIPGYIVVGLGLLGIARSRRRGRDGEIDATLDAVVAALAALTLGWLFLVNPALFHSRAPLSVRLLLSCYPPLSVFLVAITAGLAFSAGTRRMVANELLLAAMGLFLVGDVVYMLLETATISLPPHLVDVPYALAYVAFIAAVLHPSMRELTEPVPSAETAPTVGRLAIVALALAIPGIITVTRVDAPAGDRIALAVIVMSLTAAAIWRMFRALRAHARSEAHLVHQATHDTLTGLPNRAYVHEYVAQALGRARHAHTWVALLFLDLDRFKLVNDSHGHGLGDEFLLAVSRRLRSNIRPADLVARIGGDEFVVVVDGLRNESEALDVAERTRHLFVDPFDVRGSEIASSASIGVAVTDGTNTAVDAETMIRDADTAMYQAKDAGRDAVAVFDESMRDRASQRLALERDLHHALERGELHLHYQPLIDLANGRVTGFEALLRWSHPAWGQIPPLSFIPVAEDTGMIVEIGAWVLAEATRQLGTWRSQLPGGERLSMSVNLSARQLRDPQLVTRVRDAIALPGLAPGALHLELTESTLMENPAAAAELLGQLRNLGLELAIDDFGTGYSSLAYLRRFPVDQVKIDRSFVDDLDREDTSEESLVAAIVAMAGALSVRTVAEGVETLGQADRLRALGCDIAQGYLYARPVPPEQVPEVVERLEVGARQRMRAVPTAFSA